MKYSEFCCISSYIVQPFSWPCLVCTKNTRVTNIFYVAASLKNRVEICVPAVLGGVTCGFWAAKSLWMLHSCISAAETAIYVTRLRARTSLLWVGLMGFWWCMKILLLRSSYRGTIKYLQCFDIIIIFLTAIGLSPGGSGYLTCTQIWKKVTGKFKSGGLHEKHVVATWKLGNHLRIRL